MPEKIGRPKKSADTERACPQCGKGFTLPEWDKRRFCRQEHAHAYSKGRPRPVGGRIVKICPVGDHEFVVYPSHHYVTCCSREHSFEYRRIRAAQVVRKMSEGECMWFAGLFDGEGSIVLSNRKTIQPLGQHFNIQIYNTVRPLLERAVEYTGAGIIRDRKSRKAKPHHLDAYTWWCGAGEALEILRQVRPWLIVKAGRADAVLEGRSFPRQSRWDDIYPD